MGSLEMVEGGQPEKWEGKVSTKLPTAKADAAWSLLSSFCGIHRWVPGLSCQTVCGTDGQPGCVRYCASGGGDGDEDGDDRPKIWCNEELLLFDPAERTYSYKIAENNMGFGYYIATFKVEPEEATKEGGGGGCRIEWSFTSEPVDGWSFDGLVAHLQTFVDLMGAKVEEALKEEEEEEEGGGGVPTAAPPDAVAVAAE